MRTIKEIKAKISKNKEMALHHDANDIDGWNEIVEEQDELRFELLKAITDGIPLDRLEQMCNAKNDGRLVVLLCKVGDVLYTNLAMQGWYLKSKNRPYAVKVVFIGINDSEEMGYGFMNVKYEKDFMFPVNFSDIGKTVFLTKPEAEQALVEMEGLK